MTSYLTVLTSSKIPFRDKDGRLTKAFQNEKHDTASQLLKEYANRNWSRRRLNLFRKEIDKIASIGSRRRSTWSCRHWSVQWRRAAAILNMR